MRNIIVAPLSQVPLEDQMIEVVERKGIGHPDTICDSIMNEVSVNLSKEYIEKTGTILHHNIDKSLLAAGEVETRFGGGIVKKPMKLIFGDRATYKIGSVDVQVDEIAINTAKEWFKKNMRFVDPDKHVKYQIEIQPGSSALTDIFRRGGKVLEANDTSAAVGWAPLTRTEKAVLSMEKYLNSAEFKKMFPETGEDIKVMGLRKGNELELTISIAFVDHLVESEKHYFRRKDEVLEEIIRFAKENNDFDKITVQLNTLDAPGRGVDGVYLTVLGTSADGADSGQVGRGNRVNGVISLNRPQCSEAAAGKNPVSHVGKIYNLLTHKIANEINQQIPETREVYVWMVSKIGRPIDQPTLTAIQLIPEPNAIFNDIKKKAEEIVEYELDNIDKFCMELAYGKITVC
ncbi:MAG: methionine adenosyltransferase [Nitrososphaerota archaeon]|nr:methionine adenosyltransferase [Candidatus Bathyarchaeota archaeon]MDW8048748.1 methionine adenosyltransferase [Nitrososphaerota archaeon]